MTIHQLHHLVDHARLYGPLWCTWMFTFESFNGFITSFIHSKQRVEVQLIDGFMLNRALHNIEDNLPPRHERMAIL